MFNFDLLWLGTNWFELIATQWRHMVAFSWVIVGSSNGLLPDKKAISLNSVG